MPLFQAKIFLHPTPLPVITQLYAGTSADVTLADTGAYFGPWARQDVPGRPEIKDSEFGKKVVELLRRQVAAKV